MKIVNKVFLMLVVIAVIFSVGLVIPVAAEANLLLKKTVKTSNTDPFYDENLPASAIVDGNKDPEHTGAAIAWDLETGSGWYQVDMGVKAKVNRVIMTFSGHEPEMHPLDFAVDVYDGSQWMRVGERHLSQNSDLAYVFNFKTQDCQKIRVTGLNSRSKVVMNFRLLELEAFNISGMSPDTYTPLDTPHASGINVIPSTVEVINYALNKKVTATNTNEFTEERYKVSELTDGKNNPVTDTPGYLVFGNQCEYFQIDLGGMVEFSNVAMIYRNDPNFLEHRGSDFAIDVWTGSAWKRVVKQHGIVHTGENSVQKYFFEPVKGSAVRITANCRRYRNELFGFVEVELTNLRGSSQEIAKAIMKVDNADYDIPAMTGTPDTKMAFGERIDVDNNDLCFGKPTMSSVRWEAIMLVRHLTDGKYSTQAHTASFGNNEIIKNGWYQVDFLGNFKMNKVVYTTVGDGYPIDVSIDVWSEGKWVRVGQRFGMEAGKQVFYFNELTASHVRVTASKIKLDPNGEAYYKLTEIEAYLAENVKDSDVANAMQKLPDGTEEITAPKPLGALTYVQGARTADTIPVLSNEGLVPPDRGDADTLEDDIQKTPDYTIIGGDKKVDSVNKTVLVIAIIMIAVGLIGLFAIMIVYVKKSKNRSVVAKE